jgi:AraC-like DNA-binding protein
MMARVGFGIAERNISSGLEWWHCSTLTRPTRAAPSRRMATRKDRCTSSRTIFSSHFSGHFSRDQKLFSSISEFHDAISRRDELELPTLLGGVTEHLLRLTDARAPQTTQVEVGAVRHLRELIEDDPSANIRLETLATSLGSSCAHLSRAFTKAHGLPPHAYRLQLRLEQAKPKLLAGISAAQVALELGFNSQSHFITQFKRWTGVTPSHYCAG